MDSDFWTSRLAAAKRQFNLQHQHQHQHQQQQQHHLRHHSHSSSSTHAHSSQLDRLNIDDFDVEEEIRAEFPCPYCYEDFDIASLCSHLEDEHSCESKVTVCPICSVKVARNMLSHITLQHGHLFKLQRHRRLRRVAVPNSQALSLLGRDLREAHLQVLLGGSGYRSNNTTSATAITDPLLSSLVLNFPATEADELSKTLASSLEDASLKCVPLQRAWKSSFDSSLSHEEREKRMRQAAGQAVFVQDLLASTLLTE